MKRTNSTLMSAWFVVTGMTFDPHNCTRFFNVHPTDVLTKGTIRPGKRPVVPHSSWTIKTEKRYYDNTDEALQVLLKKIWPHRNRIKKAASKFSLNITFVLCINFSDKNKPFYNVSSRSIGQLEYFEAPLHLDL